MNKVETKFFENLEILTNEGYKPFHGIATYPKQQLLKFGKCIIQYYNK